MIFPESSVIGQSNWINQPEWFILISAKLLSAYARSSVIGSLFLINQLELVFSLPSHWLPLSGQPIRVSVLLVFPLAVSFWLTNQKKAMLILCKH